MLRMTLALMFVLSIASGCASSGSKSEKNMIGNAHTVASVDQEKKGEAPGAVSSAQRGTEIMKKQEADMRSALADSDSAVIRREGDLLTIILQGDAGFDPYAKSIQSSDYSELDRIARVAIKYPQTDIAVEGHTDSTGSDTYNLLLSKRRAGTVRYLLVQRGVPTHRIKVMGYGESRPVATNTTAEGRKMNRRVEIRIQPHQ